MKIFVFTVVLSILIVAFLVSQTMFDVIVALSIASIWAGVTK